MKSEESSVKFGAEEVESPTTIWAVILQLLTFRTGMLWLISALFFTYWKYFLNGEWSFLAIFIMSMTILITFIELELYYQKRKLTEHPYDVKRAKLAKTPDIVYIPLTVELPDKLHLSEYWYTINSIFGALSNQTEID